MRDLRSFGRIILISVLALLFVAPVAWSAGGGGGGGSYDGGGGSGSSARRSPQATAKRFYEAGLRQKAKAWKLEEKAAREDDAEDREKILAKAQKTYQKAIAAQRSAISADPKNYEAQNELGYALRRTGQFEEAIAAYDRALALDAAYYPAVEYRAEAYLSTGQLERAKSSYMVLFRTDRKLADQLMTAMDAWIAKQPEGEARAAFAEWVKERKALAGVGEDLSSNNTRTW